MSVEVRRAAERFPGGKLTVLSIPGGAYPVIVRGDGAKVFSGDGRSYVDFVLGSGPLIAGHAHPAVVAAVSEQIGRGSTFYAVNDKILQLADKLVDAIPCAEKIQFCTSGSEATFYAMRIARAATGRDLILRFEGGFHGGNDYAMCGWLREPGAEECSSKPSCAGIPTRVAETVLVAEFNDLNQALGLFARYKGRIAAVIVEPVERVVPPRPGFLEGLRKVCSETGALLIFDEIVTGFRIAWGGAQELYGVVPDLATYGKIIGGGYPLAAVAGASELMEHAAWSHSRSDSRAYMSGTLNGNPVAAVAGLTTLALLEQPGSYEKLWSLGETLRRGIEHGASRAGVLVQVMGVGPTFQVVCRSSVAGNYAELCDEDAALGTEVGRRVFEAGYLVREEKMYLSLAHEQGHLDGAIDAYARAFEAVARTQAR
jgi:glutamate-1-semialdehyde 2,1-aminomutase